MLKLSKKLSTKQFVISQLLIFILGLSFLGGLYYILNIPDQTPKSLFRSGPVTRPPKSLRLDLDQPEQDSLSFSPSTIVSGKTSPGISVLISTNTDDLVIKSKPDGSFSTVLDLEKGINNITVAVFDSTGKSRSSARSVYYSKEKL